MLSVNHHKVILHYLGNIILEEFIKKLHSLLYFIWRRKNVRGWHCIAIIAMYVWCNFGPRQEFVFNQEDQQLSKVTFFADGMVITSTKAVVGMAHLAIHFRVYIILFILVLLCVLFFIYNSSLIQVDLQSTTNNIFSYSHSSKHCIGIFCSVV